MATTDAFSAQIVELVRKMPDDAILELVKHQLGALGVSPLRGFTGASSRRRARPARAAEIGAKVKRRAESPKRRPGRPRKSPVMSQERQEILNNVERVVKASSGMGASDVAKSAGIPKPRASAALKELKVAKRIFQGGDRRFARYAGDPKTAEQASINARKSAAGPATPGKKVGRGKRAQGATAR